MHTELVESESIKTMFLKVITAIHHIHYQSVIKVTTGQDEQPWHSFLGDFIQALKLLWGKMSLGAQSTIAYSSHCVKLQSDARFCFWYQTMLMELKGDLG